MTVDDTPSDKPGDRRHEQAREMAEKALEHYDRGDTKTADALAEQAANLDRSAVEEVVADLDEDAADRAGKPGKPGA